MYSLSVEQYQPQRNYNCCCSICKMPTAVAQDDPECLKLKDSMETGFNPVGTRPTRACTRANARVNVPVCMNTLYRNTNKAQPHMGHSIGMVMI